jgi:nicotinate-nucleotide adenylyltransferase
MSIAESAATQDSRKQESLSMIGIFGGTFDPIHYGHLRVALDVVEALGLDEIRFLPLEHAVHRAQPLASSAQRLAMLEAAIADEPRFRSDDRELRRGGQSYTLDTLRSLREELGDTPLCLLLGGDAFNSFLSWHEPQQVAELAHLVVMERPGYALPTDPVLQMMVEQRETDLAADLRNAPGGHIWFQPVTQLDISATDIRNRVSHGRSARYLAPDPVLSLIDEHGLYRPGS